MIRGARAAPLVVLVATTLALVGLRLHRRAPSGARAASMATTAPAPLGSSASLAARAPLLANARTARGATTLHGDSARVHRASGRGPAKLPRVAWKVDVGGPVEAQVTTSPDLGTLYAASLGGSLTAIARAGTVKWRVDLGDRVYSTPCVAPEGTIYVGSDARRFFAISPDGAVRWKLEVDDEVDTAPLRLDDDRVVFAAGRALYAVRPGGDVAWRLTVRGKIFTAPALGKDGAILFGAHDHFAYAASPKGAIAWSVDLGADVDGGPVVAEDGTSYFGTDADEIVRIDSRGHVVWRTHVGGFVRGPITLGRDGDVLAGVYGPTPRVVRIDAASGRVRGAFSVQGTGAREFGVHGGPLEDDEGTLFFGTQDDAVYAVGRDGALRWRFPVGDDVDAPVTLLPDGALVVGSDDGTVVLLTP